MGDRVRSLRILAAAPDSPEFDRATGRPIMPLSELSLILTGSRDAARRHLGMIERGARVNVQITTIQSLARVFGVSLDWLVSGTGDPPNAEAVKARVDAARKGASRVAVKRTGTDG